MELYEDTDNHVRAGGVFPGSITMCQHEAAQGKTLTFRGPSLAQKTVNTWERNHTVIEGKTGACSSLQILPFTTEEGLASTLVVLVIKP